MLGVNHHYQTVDLTTSELQNNSASIPRSRLCAYSKQNDAMKPDKSFHRNEKNQHVELKISSPRSVKQDSVPNLSNSGQSSVDNGIPHRNRKCNSGNSEYINKPKRILLNSETYNRVECEYPKNVIITQDHVLLESGENVKYLYEFPNVSTAMPSTKTRIGFKKDIEVVDLTDDNTEQGKSANIPFAEPDETGVGLCNVTAKTDVVGTQIALENSILEKTSAAINELEQTSAAITELDETRAAITTSVCDVIEQQDLADGHISLEEPKKKRGRPRKHVPRVEHQTEMMVTTTDETEYANSGGRRYPKRNIPRKSNLTENDIAQLAYQNYFYCDKCYEFFIDENSLLRHEQKQHHIKSKKNRSSFQSIHAKKQSYSCNICKKSFSLKKHLKKHTSSKQCHSGNVSTGNKSSLFARARRASVRSKKAPSCACYACHKTFSSKEQGLQHVLKHFRVKTHECQNCGQRFKSLSEKRHHVTRVHAQALSYLCLDCQKGFVNLHGLHIHMGIKHKKKIKKL